MRVCARASLLPYFVCADRVLIACVLFCDVNVTLFEVNVEV